MLLDEPELYFAPATDAYYQQGDIVLAPCALLDTGPGDDIAPVDVGDVVRRRLWGDGLIHLSTSVGAALLPAMIVSHDCALDKEFNRRVEQLRRGGATKAAAIEQAAADDSLDRFVTVAPIVPLGDITSGAAELRANRVVGYFPVCPDGGRGVDEGAVDLARPTTIDRACIRGRLAILSDASRAALIYALARHWAFRAPRLTFEIETAIGRRIVDARVEGSESVELVLELDSGEELRLLQAPNVQAGAGPERPHL